MLTWNMLILVGALVAVLMALGIVWQVEKGLDEAYKILTAGLVVFIMMKLLVVLEALGGGQLTGFNGALEFIFICLVALSLLVMNRTIKRIKKR